MAPIVKVPFMSSNDRFENRQTAGIPGPGAYNPKSKINAKNEQNKILMIKNFGVNEERFKTDEEQEVIYQLIFYCSNHFCFFGKNRINQDQARILTHFINQKKI